MVKVVLCWLCAAQVVLWPFNLPGLAQGRIATDGRTQTTISTQGRTTDIHTRSVYGNNAYNTFQRFGVGSGDTVNLHVPGQADNLINLVRDGRTDIDGTLNGVRNGRIGGNVYLLNPNGIVVGPSGTINAGSLSLQTPTADFLDSVMGADGVPNSTAVGRVLSGSTPIAPGARISVYGQINTLDSIMLRGGGVDVSGALRAGSAGIAAMRSAVNLGGLVPAANTVHRDASGAIHIGTPGSVRVSGRIDASGEAGVRGGTIDIRADQNIDVLPGAVITAAGSGVNSAGGNIVVFAGDTARLANGALIDASGGDSGDGGFVEFSAIRLVSLDGGELKATSADGRTGIIYIDPEFVTYTANTVLNSSQTTVEATDTITVAAGITVSTGVSGDALIFRAPHIVLESGSKVTTKHGVGALATYGDITFETKIRSGGDLLTPTDASITVTDATIEGDNITLNALAENKGGYGQRSASATVTLDGATLLGSDVSISATAEASSSLLGSFDPQGGENQSPLATIADLAMVAAGTKFAGLPLSAVVAMADATATVEVLAGTVIDARGDVEIASSATGEVTAPTFGRLSGGAPGAQTLPSISVVYGSIDTTARTVIADGATILADGAVAVTADTETALSLTNTSVSDGQFNLGILIASTSTTTEAIVARGATIDLRDPTATDTQTVTVAATSAGSYSAGSNIVSTSPQAFAALSASFVDINETVRAELGADIIAADGISVTATSEIEEMAAGAEASTGAEDVFGSLNDRIQSLLVSDGDYNELAAFAIGDMMGAASGMSGALKTTSTINLPFQLAGVVSILTSDIDVSATITADAISTAATKPGSPADDAEAALGDIIVGANVEIAKLQNLTAGGTESKDDANTAISLAIPVTSLTLATSATIAPGVTVDASETLTVTAETALIHDPDYFAIQEAGDVLSKLSGDAGLKEVFLSSGAFATFEQEAAGENKSLGLAANVDIFDVTSTTIARIGGIDAVGTPAAATGVTAKDVEVEATSTTQSAHASGNVGDFLDPQAAVTEGKPFKDPNGGVASVGAGGTFQGAEYDISTTAEIGDNVTVLSDDGVAVTATASALLVTIGASGMAGFGDSADVAVVGVVLVNSIDSTTTARIGAGSSVTTTGADADITVTATDTVANWNFVGGLVKAENVGFGASVGVNSIDLTTVATIDGALLVDAARDISVSALSEGSSNVLALAGAITSTKPEDPAPSGSSNPTDAADSASSSAVPDSGSAATGATGAAEANSGDGGTDASQSAGGGSNPIAQAISEGTGRFGVSVAGDAAVNLVTIGTTAEIVDVATVTARDVVVDAKSDVGLFAGAGAFSFQSFQDPSQPKTVSVGIAGAYAHNAFDGNRIEARIASVGDLAAARDVLVSAVNAQSIISGAASGSAQAKPAGSGGGVSVNIAGAVTFNTFADAETLAEVVDTTIDAAGDVTVTAEDSSTIHTGAGAASISLGSKGLGAGASASVNISEADVTARIADSDIEAAAVTAEATADRSILSIAIAAAIASGQSQGISLGGAAAYNSIAGSITGEITGSTIIADGIVAARATETSSLTTIAGDATINGDVAGGLSVAAAALLGNAHARVDASDITAERLDVMATTDRTSLAIAVGIAATKGTIALKGSVVVNLAGNEDASDGREGTIAEIDGDSTITTTDGVDVGAAERTNLQSYAGSFAGGKSGVGAAVAINKADGEVTATIADATVLGAGDVSVRAVSGAASVTDTTSRSQFIGVAVSGSLGYQAGALAGAAVVNKVETRTTAEVTSAAQLGTSGARVGAVNVSAADRTVAGSGTLGFSVSKGAALAASAAVDLLDKETTARLAGTTYAAENVIVDAKSSQAAYGGLVSLAFGSMAISVAVGVAEQNNTTLAEIAGGAIVHTLANVHVNAEDKADVIRFTASAGLASVQTQTSTTTARIGDAADVTALAQSGSLAVRSGALAGGIRPDDDDASSGTTSTATDELSDTNDDVGGAIAANIQATNVQDDTGSNTNAEQVDATAVLGAQTAVTETVTGVAVTAHSDQRMINLGLGVAVSNGISAAGAATVSIIEGTTTAEIGENAQINQGAGTAGATQDVVVRAKTNGLTVDTAVGIAVASSVGVGAGVDVVLLDKTTTARIGKGADVTAARDIAVEADNDDQTVSVTFSLAGGSSVGVAGAVGVATLSNTARAVVEAGTSAATAARLSAGDDITIAADNRTDVFHMAGSVGIGVSAAGAGIGVSVITAESTTEASLGAYTIADANDDLVVDTTSDARLKSATVAFGVGKFAGIAGGISVKSLKTTTLAEIGANAAINQNATDPAATASQTVSVTAADTSDILSVVGAGGGGLAAGLAAGVDIITLKGTATARIGAGADVRATDDIVVDVDLGKKLDAYTVAAGVSAGAGVGAAVTVIKAGGSLSTAQRSAVSDGNGDDAAGDQVADLTGGGDGVLEGIDLGSGEGSSTATANANTAQARGNASGDIAASGVIQSTGNDAIAEIGDNATVTTGGDLTVAARNVTEVDALTGGIGVGSVGVGAGLAFVDVNTLVTARIGAGADVTVGGNLSLTATDGDSNVESSVLAFAGAGAYYVALGAAIADFDFNTTTRAEIGNGAIVTVAPDTNTSDGETTGQLVVTATEQNRAMVEAYGAIVAGAAAIGAQVADLDKRGSVTAEVVDAASSATGARLSAGTLAISAFHGGSTRGRVAGGTAAFGAAVGYMQLDLLDDVDVTTRIGNFASLTAAERMTIAATSAPRVVSQGYGGIGAAGIAVGITEVEARADITSLVATGTGVSFNSPGAVSILAQASRPGGDDNVEADAVTGSGALLGGVTAIDARTILNSDVRTTLGSDNSFAIGTAGDGLTGTLEIGTNAQVAAEADAKGGAGGFLAVGAVQASSTVTSSSTTTIGAGTGGTVEGALSIVSLGSESLDTRTVGGAGGLIAGASATATNTFTATVATTLAANTTTDGFTAGMTTIAARHGDGRVLANSDARAGYLFGSTGAYASNTGTADVDVSIGDNVRMASTGELLIEAANQMTKAADGDAVYAASGGVAGGAATKSATQFRSKVDVTIGAADIRTLDDDNVFTTNDVKVRAYSNTVGTDVARLDTGGAIAVARSESRILAGSSVDRDRSRVTLQDGAVVWSEDGDVAIGARTDADIYAEANAKTYGLAGAAEGVAEARIFADNSVVIGENARVYAEESVAIRAGADDRASNAVETVARTRLYNRTVIPIENDPKADAESNITSTITAEDGSRINAVRNIDLVTNSDGISADGFGRAQDLYQEVLAAIGSFFSSLFGGGPVTIEDTYSGSHTTVTTEIDLGDTEVRAGYKNKQILEIAATPVDTVSPNPLDEGATYRNYVPVLDADGNPIQSEGITYTVRNDISLETTLRQAIIELQAKIEVFEGDTKTKLALENDLAVLEGRYQKLIDGSGTVTFEGTELPSLAGVTVDYIIVDDVIARSGDVSITTQRLNGAGTITAPGDTRIEIVNHSAAFLQVGDLTIPEEQGGRIFFNGAIVDSKSRLDQLNSGTSTAALFSTANTTPEIVVTTTYGSRPGETRAADLIVTGDVYNPVGSVVMTTEGNLDLSGNVRSATVSLSAGGDFTKSFTYGFTHIGGLPRQQFASVAEPNEDQVYDPLLTTATDSASLANYDFNTGSSIVAAGDVYISGERVNINGLIQSGIAKQSVTLTTAHANAVLQIDEAYAYYLANQSADWSSRPNAVYRAGVCISNCQTMRSLAIASFTSAGKSKAAETIAELIDTRGSKTLFEIATGANTFIEGNSSASDVNEQVNRVERSIGAAYNAVTREIEVDNAVAEGGRVQIFGELMSTGGGQINVLDGFARIDIRNDTTVPVVIGNVSSGGTARATETGDVASGRTGRVRLIDPRYLVDDPTGRLDGNGDPLQIARVIDYVRVDGQVRAYDNTTVDAAGNPSTEIALADAGDRTASFTPTPSSSHYGWTTGQSETDKDEVTYRKRVGQAFGIDLGAIGDLLASDPANVYYDPPPVPQGEPQAILVPVDTDGDGVDDAYGEVEYMTTGTDDTYGFEFERNNISNQVTKRTSDWCSKSGWIFGCFERTYQTVVTTIRGNQLYYRHSVPADQKVGIGFLGYDSGTVNIASAGDINLVGSVSNTSGTTSITSTGGSILQRTEAAVTTADVLNLSASAGRIGGEGAVASLSIDLMERDGARVNAVAGQGLSLTEKRGTLRFDNLIGGTGDVKVTSDGAIRQTTTTGRVRGTNIDLTAKAGGITGVGGTVYIDTGAATGTFNATAAGDIAVTEVGGDLRIGKVKTGADVAITVEGGNLLDANANDVRDTATEQELLAIWNSNALLDGADAQASRDASIAASTAKAKDDYAFYWATREAEGSYDPGYAFTYDAGERAAMLSSGLTPADIATVEADKTALYHAMHGLVGGSPKSDTYAPTDVIVTRYEKDGKIVGPNEPGAVKVFAAVDIEDSGDGYAWTETDLRASISKTLISARGDTSTVIEDANIEARNITIDVKDGQLGSTIGEMAIAPKAGGLTDDERIALAAAERDDITFLPDEATATSIILAQREDVDIKASGTVDIKAKDHVFLGSEDSDINIVRAQSETRDIRIKTGGAITNADTTDAAVVQSANVILEAQDGIGTDAKPLTGTITGNFTARSSGGNVHFEDRAGDLDVDFVFAGGKASLTATMGSILDPRGDADDNILAGSILLTARTNVGGAFNALDVKVTDTGGLIDVTATDGSIWITATDLDLNVGVMNAATAVNLTTLNGSLIGGAITATAGSVALSSAADIDLGDITAGGGLSAIALNGAIAQADGDAASVSGTMLLRADGDITIAALTTTSTASDAVTIESLTGGIHDGGDLAIDITANAPGAVTTLIAATGIGVGNALETSIAALDASNTTAGVIAIDEADDLTILGLGQSAAAEARIVAAGDMTIGGMATSAGALVLTSAGDLIANAALSGTSVALTGTGSVELDADVTATMTDITIGSDGSVTTAAPLLAQRSIVVTALGDISVGGTMTATTGGISANAGGAYDQTADATAATDIEVTSGGDATITANLDTATGRIDLDAAGTLGLTGNANAEDGIAVVAGTDATILGDLTSRSGAVSIDAGGDLGVTGDASGATGVATTSGGETSIVGTVTSALGRIVMSAVTALGLAGTATGETGVELTSGTSTTVTGDLVSNAGGITVATGSTLGLTGSATAGGPVTLTSGTDTSILGDLTSTSGDVVADAGGDFAQAGNVSGRAVSLTSGSDTVIVGDVTATLAGIAIAAGQDAGIDGAMAARDAISVDAARDVRLTVTTAVAGSDVAVTAGRDAVLTGDVTATAGTLAVGAGADATFTGSATALGDLALRAGDDVRIDADLLSRSGTMAVTAGDRIDLAGTATTRRNDIALRSGGDLAVDGTIASNGGAITMVGGNDVTLSPSTVLASRNGTISLTAHGPATAAGVLSQAKGSGRIDAARGEVILRAGTVALENPIIAGTFSIAASGPGGTIKLGALSVFSDLAIRAANVEIGDLVHTGHTQPLLLDIIGPGGRMSDSVVIGGSSVVGLTFGTLSTRDAEITFDTPQIVVEKGRIGERGVFTSSVFQTVLDNTSTARLPTDLQLYQARPGEVFFLAMDGTTFATDVDTIGFDRTLLVREFLPGQGLATGSDDVVAGAGMTFTENSAPLAGTVTTTQHSETTAAGYTPDLSFTTPGAAPGGGVDACAMAAQINLGGLGGC